MAHKRAETRTYRAVWFTALRGLLKFAEELKVATERAYPSTAPCTVERSTMIIGLRGRRLLQAARVLALRKWDDVVGNLTRALVDTVIDLDYLRVESTYGERTVTPADKACLFETQRFVMAWLEHQASGKPLLPELEEHFRFAESLRAKHGVLVSHSWHGRSITGKNGILKELRKGADEDALKRLAVIESVFRITSFLEHNNANPNAYIKLVSKNKAVALETSVHSEPIRRATQAGAEICYRWGVVLGHSEEELYKKLKPVERASKVNPMSCPADA